MIVFARRISGPDGQFAGVVFATLATGRFDELLSAVELALESGVPSKLHVLNLLGRLVEQLPPAPVTTPQDLVLGVEPQANVIRYDSLREKRHAA